MSEEYFKTLLEKFKQDPLYEVRQEFGQFLFRHIDSLSPDELKRYNELKEILKQQSHDTTSKLKPSNTNSN